MGNFVEKEKINLSKSTLFYDEERLGAEYLCGVDVDRLLAPLFEVHNLPTPNGAIRYSGWERKSGSNWEESPETFTLAGHSLGHFLSAISQYYAVSNDSIFKDKIDYIISQLDLLQNNAESGYIGGCKEICFTELFNKNLDNWAEGYWVPWYNIHKIYKGLIDTYYATKSEQALKVLLRFANWATDGLSNLSDDEFQKMLECEHGGMNEVFANLYEITGEIKYLETAKRFTHKKLFDFLKNGEDLLKGWHANTQIPKVIGMAAIYRANPKENYEYRLAAENFWHFVVDDRSYAIGGNSVGEHFEEKGKETLDKKTCESCNTYNMMRLCEYLYSFEEKAEYFDWYEDALYNHILSQQEKNTGAKMYFVSLLQGHHKTYEKKYESWWCCTGTGMENPSKFRNCIYFENESSFFINLFIPNEVETENVNLKLETDYPYSNKIKINVKNFKKDSLKIRIPYWSDKKAQIVVNGKVIKNVEKGYFTFENIEPNSEIEITLSMELREYNSREKNTVALKYGPITLCAPLGRVTENVSEYISNELLIDDITVSYPNLLDFSLDKSIKALDKEKLSFEISKEYSSLSKPIILKPFFETQHEFYTVYFNKE